MPRSSIKFLNIIKENYSLELLFVLLNLTNGLLLRINTVKNVFRLSPFLIDLGFLILMALSSNLIRKKKKIYYLTILTIIFTLTCVINSIYYNYYNSFASFSILANITFAGDVSDAIFENVLKLKDLVYICCPILFYIGYTILKKKKNIQGKIYSKEKEFSKKIALLTLIIFLTGAVSMPINSWNRLYKLWNRESVVMNYGVYVYQLDDFIQSLTPKINSMFGHDKALKKVTDYYNKNKYIKKENEYTNIFENKNVLVIHAESMQTFPMNLKFNGKEVTPNLNKLASEGMFFNNFYAEVGVGTSSDSEFTFNTSLMPSTKGTAFVNYFDREYVAIPNLLRKKEYYTFSMHANTGDFWNRNNMYKALGYDKFYSKDSYIIDEEIGLGLSDESFFRQSIDKLKEIKDKRGSPYYGLLITLSNHTPFNDLELTEEFDTSVTVETDDGIAIRNYLDGTTMNNYLRSVHYADNAIGEFISGLDKEGLLEDTVIIIYGDHDARLSYNEFNLLYNYDPVNDRIKEIGEEGYIPYNEYDYELDKKVPLIIWTKTKEVSTTVTVPMGMLDVLPTIGNMLGIHSDFQLGKDIFSLEDNDNTVVFVDGSYLTSKIYYNAPKGEIYAIINNVVSEKYIKKRAEYATNLIDVSNDIISYNLIKEMKGVCSR